MREIRRERDRREIWRVRAHLALAVDHLARAAHLVHALLVLKELVHVQEEGLAAGASALEALERTSCCYGKFVAHDASMQIRVYRPSKQYVV